MPSFIRAAVGTIAIAIAVAAAVWLPGPIHAVAGTEPEPGSGCPWPVPPDDEEDLPRFIAELRAVEECELRWLDQFLPVPTADPAVRERLLAAERELAADQEVFARTFAPPPVLGDGPQLVDLRCRDQVEVAALERLIAKNEARLAEFRTRIADLTKVEDELATAKRAVGDETRKLDERRYKLQGELQTRGLSDLDRDVRRRELESIAVRLAPYKVNLELVETGMSLISADRREYQGHVAKTEEFLRLLRSELASLVARPPCP